MHSCDHRSGFGADAKVRIFRADTMACPYQDERLVNYRRLKPTVSCRHDGTIKIWTCLRVQRRLRATVPCARFLWFGMITLNGDGSRPAGPCGRLFLPAASLLPPA